MFENALKKEKGKEYIKELLNANGTRVEIITSYSSKSAENFWYDQEENEFVSVLSGSAALDIDNKIVNMKKGDYVIISPHVKHRVLKTSPVCVWLCIYYK